MVDLPKKKVGIIACSGEELAEGTVTRLAALKVLEHLRPDETVTICLPLFLAGGEGDRAFARFYPTIAIDGCDQRCAARGTEKYSGKPAASLVVSDLAAQAGLGAIRGRQTLNSDGLQAVEMVAGQAAQKVDELLGKQWSRGVGAFVELETAPIAPEPLEATCSCGSGIPVRKVLIAGQWVTLAALPLIFAQFHQAGKPADEASGAALLAQVGIYNSIPAGQETLYAEALLHDYRIFCRRQEAEA
jgi:uncharacterized metal-binding protein